MVQGMNVDTVASKQTVDIYVATPEQLSVAVERHSVEWSNGVSSEEYAIREAALHLVGIGKGITCYVLAPTSDPTTLDFFCSLEVYRRPILVSSPGSKAVYRDVAYSIASVFTPLQHRKQGHCRSMMNLLHSKIARPSTEEGNIERVVKLERTSGPDAKMSFLYSDVGEFYQKCNWHIIEPTETKWVLADLPQRTPLDASLRLLTMKDLASVAAADSEMLRVELSHSDPTKTSFAVDPSGGEYEWLESRVNFYADRLRDSNGLLAPKRPIYFGVESGTRGGAANDWSLLIVTMDYFNSKLKIIRTRCATPEHYAMLLNFALITAEECGLKNVIAWVVEEKWLATLDGAMQGTTYARDESLSAVSWYGSEKNGSKKEQGDKVEWMANELYAWV